MRFLEACFAHGFGLFMAFLVLSYGLTGLWGSSEDYGKLPTQVSPVPTYLVQDTVVCWRELPSLLQPTLQSTSQSRLNLRLRGLWTELQPLAPCCTLVCTCRRFGPPPQQFN